MDPMAEVESIEPELEVVGEKRPIENGGDGELMVPVKKKARFGTEEMKRVAEIVLVLSAMAEMRGGRSPTAVETDMMAEAREKVAAMCEALTPKDLVEKEAVGAVIEDLGLNSKSKEQKLGFRPPKMSIAEKLLLTKRRMEESKEFAAHSGTYSSQRLQTSLGAAAESRGLSHTVRAFPSDKPTHAPTSSGGLPTSSPIGHVSAATSTSSPYQFSTNEGRPFMVSSGLPSNHSGKDSSSLALPRVERANFRLDGGVRPVQADTAPTWSVQLQNTSAAKSGPEVKVQNHNSVKVEGAASRMAPQATKDQTSRPIITQTTSGNLPNMQPPTQVMNFIQAPSLSNNHNEIGKVVHKLLQPRLPEHPTWTPPSRDYMNKALTCQICQLTFNEVEGVLLCDACEKGFHLKCLQSYNQKGVPRGEWHCPKCLTLSNGKPLPPKYGRVMRNMNTPKVPSKIAGLQAPSEKKIGTSDQKVSQQKITANGSSSIQSNPHTGTTGTDCIESGSASETPSTKEMQGNSFSSSRKFMDEKLISESFQNDSMKSMGADCGSPAVSKSGKLSQQGHISKSSPSEEKSASVSASVSPTKLPDTVANMSDHGLASNNLHDVEPTGQLNCAEVPPKKQPDNTPTVKNSDMRETFDTNTICDIARDDQDVAQKGCRETSGSSARSREHAGVSTDGLHNVDWIGDTLKVVDEKIFYNSCCINGVSYKVQDHALFRSSNDKLIPSKLQAMWEDSKTGSKWVIVNYCYSPEGLPEVVGRPCTPESSEVYESNRDSTVMAGLIQGPCKVLPSDRYKEESERTRLGSEASDGLRPVFLCKWLYDELKGLFQPVSS